MTEQRPAVEFVDDDDPDDSSSSWMTYAVVALVFGAITIALAIPGIWDEYVVGYSSRRYRGLVNVIEAIGYWPIVLVGAAITVAAGISAVRSFTKHRPNEKD
jgi:hypothetical protein